MTNCNSRIPVHRLYAAVVALLFLVFLISTHLTPAQNAPAQNPPPQGKLFVVSHVDILGGGNLDKGIQLLKQFAADSRHDPGSVRFEILQEDGHRNHFTMVEVWQSTEAFQSHEAADHTKRFRTDLFPILGSPFDQRWSREVN